MSWRVGRHEKPGPRFRRTREDGPEFFGPASIPVERPLDRLAPFTIEAGPLVTGPGRMPALVRGPVADEILRVRPEPGRQSGRIGGSERRRLDHLRAHDRDVEDVGL